MPDDEYSRGRKGVDSNTRGRIFQNGLESHFRDRENGFIQQSRTYRTDAGNFQVDKTRDDRGEVHTIEEKSGRIDGDKDRTQLRGIRAALEQGLVQHHTLRSVEGEYVDPQSKELINA
ncbi:hypothetical protein ACWDYH_02525 [Nocardia goodfellowii]